MAEAVGLAASILQLAGAGAKLSVALYNFTNSAAHADRDVKYITDDVELTTNALDSVGKVFQTQNAEFIVSKKAIQDANNIIKKCEDVFNEISAIVEKRRRTDKDGKKSLSVMGKLSWPMKEPRIELNRRRLESLKNSLMLLLHVLQLAQSQAKGKTDTSVIKEERDKIRELHQRQQDSLQILQALESKFSNVALSNEETLPTSTTTPRAPTLNLMSSSQSTTLPPLEKTPKSDANTITVDLSAADDSDISESDATATDDDDDHFSLEELAKCAKQAQKLLKRITLLQRDFDGSRKTGSRCKRRVHKMYRRFCSKFESEIDLVAAASVPVDKPRRTRERCRMDPLSTAVGVRSRSSHLSKREDPFNSNDTEAFRSRKEHGLVASSRDRSRSRPPRRDDRGYDSGRHGYNGCGRRSRYHSRSRSRSRSRGGHKSVKWEQAAKAALVAGAVEAFRSRKEDGPWTGAEGQRVATAALGAAGIDSLIDRDPNEHSKRHVVESTLGGIVASRLANGSRSQSPARRRYSSRSRSRSRSVFGRSRSRGRGRSSSREDDKEGDHRSGIVKIGPVPFPDSNPQLWNPEISFDSAFGIDCSPVSRPREGFCSSRSRSPPRQGKRRRWSENDCLQGSGKGKKRKIVSGEEEILGREGLEFLETPVMKERDIVDVLLDQWTVR